MTRGPARSAEDDGHKGLYSALFVTPARAKSGAKKKPATAAATAP